MIHLPDYIKCPVCAIPWSEHTPPCAGHRLRDNLLAAFREALPTLTANELQVISVNGWNINEVVPFFSEKDLRKLSSDCNEEFRKREDEVIRSCYGKMSDFLTHQNFSRTVTETSSSREDSGWVPSNGPPEYQGDR